MEVGNVVVDVVNHVAELVENVVVLSVLPDAVRVVVAAENEENRAAAANVPKNAVLAAVVRKNIEDVEPKDDAVAENAKERAIEISAGDIINIIAIPQIH